MCSPITRLEMVNKLGQAELSRYYYESFRAIGGFATGFESIIAKWARFTSEASTHEPVELTTAIGSLLDTVDETRSVSAARILYHKLISDGAKINCVWSGKTLTARSLAVDHVIPFSIWGNNELWNLLPSNSIVNGKKSNRIPHPDLINSQQEIIGNYWNVLHSEYAVSFEDGFRLSLYGLDANFNDSGWIDDGIKALMNKCSYLINERGFESWSLTS